MNQSNLRYVLYVGHMLFPWGQAASRRVYGNAMSVVHSGRDVVVLSGNDGPSELTLVNQIQGIGSLYHVGLGGSPSKSDSAFKKAKELFLTSSQNVIKWLDSQTVKPSHIILYGGYSPFLIRLLPWCRRNNIPLIADIVEWHSASQFSGGVICLPYLNVELSMRYLFPKCDAIISISNYLSKYYKSRGCLTITIPPTTDLEVFKASHVMQSESANLIKLIYAGSPAKKDLLKPIIEGLNIVDPEGKFFKLTIIGPSQEEVLSHVDNSTLPKSVEVLGSIPQTKVGSILRKADFSVLLRPHLKYAEAGFSTKFVESLSNGLPVIANLTGDMGFYLRDGSEGLVCADPSVDAFVFTLQRAMSLSKHDLHRMKVQAFLTAEKFFDYKNYIDELDALLKSTEKF